MSDPEKEKIVPGRKETLSCGFVGLLIALAYAEMMPPIRDAVQTEGLTFATVALFWVFFLTAFRMFVGNTLHLHDRMVVNSGKWLWLYDFGVIVAETVTLIFLAGVCSVAASRKTSVDFVDLLVLLYAVDVVWVLSHRPLRGVARLWRRRASRPPSGPGPADVPVPWRWALQNSLLLLGILAPRWIWPAWDFYSNTALAWLALIHVAAFLHSVIYYDFHGLFGAEPC